MKKASNEVEISEEFRFLLNELLINREKFFSSLRGLFGSVEANFRFHEIKNKKKVQASFLFIESVSLCERLSMKAFKWGVIWNNFFYNFKRSFVRLHKGSWMECFFVDFFKRKKSKQIEHWKSKFLGITFFLPWWKFQSNFFFEIFIESFAWIFCKASEKLWLSETRNKS